jgi:hypothetical protein
MSEAVMVRQLMGCSWGGKIYHEDTKDTKIDKRARPSGLEIAWAILFLSGRA